jgi:Zn-dependent protease/CBS domain-containing protein
MNGGIRLGKILGFEISLDYSWFIIFALIIYLFSFSVFPQLVPGLRLTIYLIVGVVTAVLFFGSVLFHELMHSLVARVYGINIAGIRLMIFGGVSQISEEPPTPGIEFTMAVAGPLSSIVLGVIFLGIYLTGRRFGFVPYVNAASFYLGYVNVFLGIFNLLPGFPLDGGRVFRSIVWYFTGDLKRATGIAAGIGKGIAYAMIFFGIVGLFGGNASLLWLALIGWFLLRAAEAEYQEVVYHEALKGVKVGQIMTQNPVTLDPDMTIEDAVRDYFYKHDWVAYPVVKNGDISGIINLKSIQALKRENWANTHVGDIMRPLSPEIVTEPDVEVFNILPKLVTMADGRMLVIKEGLLVGILSSSDVNRAIIRRLHLSEEAGRPAA